MEMDVIASMQFDDYINITRRRSACINHEVSPTRGREVLREECKAVGVDPWTVYRLQRARRTDK